MTDTLDPATTYLAEVRERLEDLGYTEEPGGVMTSGLDAARLLGAVEAVLALADKLAARTPTSSALDEDRMWVRQECAGMIREAITDALAGTGD